MLWRRRLSIPSFPVIRIVMFIFITCTVLVTYITMTTWSHTYATVAVHHEMAEHFLENLYERKKCKDYSYLNVWFLHGSIQTEFGTGSYSLIYFGCNPKKIKQNVKVWTHSNVDNPIRINAKTKIDDGPDILIEYGRIPQRNDLWVYRLGLPYLSPNTIYFKKENFERDSFTAVPHSSNSKSINMIVFGCTEESVPFRHMLKHVDNSIRAETHPYSSFVHLGNSVQSSSPFSDFFAQFSSLERTLPIVATFGNLNMVTSIFNETRLNAVRPYYSISIGMSRFIVLDSENLDKNQERWLRLELLSPLTLRAHFIVVIVHAAPFKEYHRHWKGENDIKASLFVRSTWVPIFEKAGVSLVLSANSQIYQRGIRNGITYVVSGGGGEPLNSPSDRIANYEFYNITQYQHHFGTFTVQDCLLRWKAYGLNHMTLDSFSIPSRDTACLNKNL